MTFYTDKFSLSSPIIRLNVLEVKSLNVLEAKTSGKLLAVLL